MDALHLLTDLAIAFAAALLAGIVSLRLKQPVLMGYLIAGMLIGPYGLRLITGEAEITHLSEIGVILLMFALGVEFSLAQFRPIRWLVLIGGGLFIGLTTVATAETLLLMGQPLGRDILLGFVLALSSTIIVLRLLMERHEIDSIHGRTMLGWLILQDIAVVPMIVAIPFLAQAEGGMGLPLVVAMGKVVAFLAVMFLVGTRLFPPILGWIARMRHKEILFLAVIGLVFGTAAISAAFGLSLALGAFLAGLVISQSDEHRQVLAEVLPIRDLFVTLFFVSIGMMIDLVFVVTNLPMILGLVATIMIGKSLLGAGIALGFKLSLRTSLLVGMGLSQIGEFSFVLAREGRVHGLLSESLFSATLAVALLTMLLTPAFIGLSGPVSRYVARLAPRLAQREDLSIDVAEPLRDHVVIVGYGRVGAHLGTILHQRGVPLLVIDLDPHVLRRLQQAGVRTLYGDAGMHEVLVHADLAHARLLVLALPDPGTSALVLEQARALNPQLEVIVRVHRPSDMAGFHGLGASAVVQPEFEGSLAMVRQALTRLGWPPHLVHSHLATLRRAQAHQLTEQYSPELSEALLGPPPGKETAWLQLPEQSALVGRRLAEADLPGRTGAHVLVVKREDEHLIHPTPEHALEAGDFLLVLGTPDELEGVLRALEGR